MNSGQRSMYASTDLAKQIGQDGPLGKVRAKSNRPFAPLREE